MLTINLPIAKPFNFVFLFCFDLLVCKFCFVSLFVGFLF